MNHKTYMPTWKQFTCGTINDTVDWFILHIFCLDFANCCFYHHKLYYDQMESVGTLKELVKIDTSNKPAKTSQFK